MEIERLQLVLLIVFLLTPAGVSGQRSGDEPGRTPSLDAYLKSRARADFFSGAVLVVHREEYKKAVIATVGRASASSDSRSETRLRISPTNPSSR